MGLLKRFWRRLAGRWLGTVITVNGTSMRPTFSEGDRAIIEPGRYRTGQPQRFDVVVVRTPDVDREDIKRIIGLPGELIEIRDGALWIDGLAIEEPHILDTMPPDWLHAWGTRADEYVVLGDNRAAPGITDSRRYGPLSRNAIVGPVTRHVV
ncbi:MAG: signal peptidase I [Dehalococcoidia bacterium]|jgi:signal peptidase I|nr:signal peptidase I [Dehalococcoidia bacterium]